MSADLPAVHGNDNTAIRIVTPNTDHDEDDFTNRWGRFTWRGFFAMSMIIVTTAAVIWWLITSLVGDKLISATEPQAATTTGEWLAVVKDGQDLGDVGRPYGVSRMQMIAWNMPLIRANTAKCKELGLTSGICTLNTFAGERLAWDALWEGDKAVIAQETR